MTDKLDAKLEQAKGTVKEAFGKLTDDKKIEAEGVVDKVAGKAKELKVSKRALRTRRKMIRPWNNTN